MSIKLLIILGLSWGFGLGITLALIYAIYKTLRFALIRLNNLGLKARYRDAEAQTSRSLTAAEPGDGHVAFAFLLKNAGWRDLLIDARTDAGKLMAQAGPGILADAASFDLLRIGADNSLLLPARRTTEVKICLRKDRGDGARLESAAAIKAYIQDLELKGFILFDKKNRITINFPISI